MKKVILFFVLFGFTELKAQINYTQNNFVYDSLINVVYGTATNYAGNTDTLLLDIYKPVGDNNCLRPVIILIHGGAWIRGSKEQNVLVYMARQLAQKGWVVASINYRQGTHKAASYQMYSNCNTTLSEPCAYVNDSSEILRANFRGMQDAKGAIRFMKSRNAIDSTDINNVFLAGESAGGFIALSAAFKDSPNEKFPDCFAIPDAPQPDTSLNVYTCNPAQISFARPDLGTIDGSLNLGVFNAKVKGAASFCGGVFDLKIFKQMTDTPCVYLYHQGSDIVVNYLYGPLLGRTSQECFAQTNLCQNYNFYPYAYGGESIRQYFVSLGSSAPVFRADIVNNYSYLNNCSSNGHKIDSAALRLQSMIDFFAPKIALSGNNPAINCLSNDIEGIQMKSPIIVYPNPAQEIITVMTNESGINKKYELFDSMGRRMLQGNFSGRSIDIKVEMLPKGIYFLNVIGKSSAKQKIVKN